jgi:hypothetical protein
MPDPGLERGARRLDLSQAVELSNESLEAAKKSGRDNLVLASEIEQAESLLAQQPASDNAYGRLKSASSRAFAKRDLLERPDQGIALHRMVDYLVETVAEAAIARGQIEDAWSACEQSRARILVKQLLGAQLEPDPPANNELSLVRQSLAGLGENTVLIEYYIGAKRSWMFLMRPGLSLTALPIDMTRSRLMRAFENFEREVPGFATLGDVGEQWTHDLQPLVEGLGSYLRSNDHLIVIPSAHMFFMPFHAIPISGERIGLRWPVSYLPAAALLRQVQTSGVGDLRVVLASVFDEEAEVVRKLVSGRIIREGLKQDYLTALRDADFVHISAHGVFCPQVPEMSGLIIGDPERLATYYSGVSKARYARTESEQQAISLQEEYRESLLTAADLEGVNLGREAFVVLSACESGLSRLDEAADPNGLTRALLISGAKTIISSVWKVDPETTAEMMRIFYLEFAERGWSNPAAALRAAEAKIAEQHPHPYYWAPFFILGGLPAAR